MTRIQKQFIGWFVFILADLVVYGIYRSYFMYLPFLHDFMSYIYMTMVLLWGRSVRTRIIHPQMRYCLTGVAFSLLALLFLALWRL